MTNTPIDEIFLDWLSANQKNAWMVIPVLAFLEACPGLGLLASGIILLSVSTILYTEQIVSIYQIMPLAFIGACLSDHLGFYLGRWFGPKFHHTAFAKKQAVRLQKGEAFILKYGAAAIIVGRLMTAVRSLVPMMVGISGTDRVKFTLIDILACAIWCAGLGLLVVGLDTVIPG
jgi:membrane protein DedA with SNARE-associated domain